MAMTWDLTDVPTVATADLAAAMQALIDNERGLVLLRGLADEDLDTVQATLQRRFHGEPQRALPPSSASVRWSRSSRPAASRR